MTEDQSIPEANEVSPESTPSTPEFTAETTPEATPAPSVVKDIAPKTKTITTPKTEPQDGHWWWGTGRRKAAVARVRIRPGTGSFTVNKKDLTEYFTELRDHKDIMKVLEKTNTKGSLDVFVNTNGGGYTGQGGAIILGLGRALAKYDPSLDGVLRSNGYLSRDPRRVERKKPGQPGARKRFQFSKR
ncbi:MAG: 30S ribosomal protein S9 [Phycisphaerae bacterium]|nr:30S ribosomal protein S9 [Phycisphaerae bacterium]|tara:strand:+ start:4451 stop:5011 length:561 start_codon:yes stop_codon:yes gene_type:complete